MVFLRFQASAPAAMSVNQPVKAQHLLAGRPQSQRERRRKRPPPRKTLLAGSAGPGEREKERKRRAAEAILLSPLNLSPSLFPLLPAHSFFLLFSPGPAAAAALPVLLALNPPRSPETQSPGSLSRVRRSREQTDRRARTHSCMQGGKKCIHRNTHTFLGKLPHTKTKYRSLVSPGCE